MDELEKNIKKRSTLRTATTKTIKKLEEEIIATPPNRELIEEWLSLLVEKEQDLLTLNKEIEADISEAKQFEKEISTSETYKEEISICKTRVNRCIKKLQQGNNLQDKSIVSNSVISNSSAPVKLPRLIIDKFNGDICKWPNFWAQFKSAIHENESLNNVEKFNYLRSYLTGDAERAISGFSLVAENYSKAIAILESRFGKTELQIDSHITKLLSLAPCRCSRDITSLRNIYDTCQIEMNSLESLGIQPNAYGALLFPLLIRIIPHDIALDFNRSHDAKENKITDLLEFLKKEVESRERTLLLTKPTDNTSGYLKNSGSNQFRFNKQNKEKFKWYENKNKELNSSAAALSTVVDNFCVFCNKVTNHLSDECNRFNIVEKKSILKRNGRCFLCFKKFHIKKLCKVKVECNVCHKTQHRKGLCEQVYPLDVSSSDQDKSVNNSETVLASIIPQRKENEIGKQTVFLQTLRAVVVGSTAKTKVRILLDSGSQCTFIHQNLSKKLNLPIIDKEKINLHTFGSNTAVNTTRRKVKFQLCNIEDESKCITIQALESPEICNALIEIPSKELNERIQSSNIKLSDCEGGGYNYPNIDILIGSDYFWEITSGKTKRLSSSVMLIDTLMGWAIQGPVENSFLNVEASSIGVLSAIVMKDFDDDQLVSTQLKAFWELESLGIHNDPLKQSVSNEEALQNFESTLTFKKGRYEVHLPWKHDSDNLVSNYGNVRKRLDSLVRRFHKDPSLYVDYKSVIEEYRKLGIIEPVNEQADGKENPVYYLPHQPVIRKDKDTTKLRIVFDASPHPPHAPSLNDLLHPGPNLNPDLLNLILKFRLNRIAFIADIEKAFLQVGLAESDRDAVRFLWIDDLPDDVSQIEPKILRMTRVLFGVTSSPFLLAAVIKFHIRQYSVIYPDTCLTLNESMYVDDLLAGAPNEEEGFKRSKEANLIMKEAGMTLRKWKRNSPVLHKLWSDSNFETSSSDSHHVSLKVLGLLWDPQMDIFKFDVTNLMKFIASSDNTKRTIIRAAGRIFDPVGFLSPFTVRVKLFFQELWERGVHWDEEVPEDIAQQWKTWCEELLLVNNLEIPRCYFGETKTENLKGIQLHCFTDASEKVYGAVIFIRYKTQNNVAKVSFLVSKSRVAPLKKLTIPRLELTAALIGARLISHVGPIFQKFHLNVSYHCWSDSNITLCWIKGSSTKWKPFVENRVREIQSLTEPKIWQHCPGRDNPADIITRKKNISELLQSTLWWTGPQWLKDEDNWPRATYVDPSLDILKIESRDKEISVLTVINEALFDLKRYEKLSKIIRVTAWIQRFIHNLKEQNKKNGPLDSVEITEAENYWITYTQESAFKLEKYALKNGEEIPSNSKIKCFNPYLDDNNVIRLGGRLHFADLTEEEKHPTLLPDKHEFSILLIKECHERVAHCGLAATLTQLRENYWILKARKNTKSVIKNCLTCKKFRAKPFCEKTAPLPSDRIKMSAAFEVIGIDFAGPIYFKDKNTVQKAYICLFTCATTRAIHLELVSNLSTETFILALKRFINRRGMIRIVYTDNVSTFKKADKELQHWKDLKRSKLQDYFSTQKIQWNYSAPLAAWWGGFWERMVRTVKMCLKKILGKALLMYEEMTTVLTEVEAIVNSRPLTYTYDDAMEPSPITPSHFLVGKRLTSLPTRNIVCNSSSSDLRKRLKYQQTLLENFWRRWKEQYLLELRSNHSVSPFQTRSIKVNDIVLLGGAREPRHMWKMGKVTEVFPGRDGKIRSCAVKTSSGTVKRPVQLLYNLELSD